MKNFIALLIVSATFSWPGESVAQSYSYGLNSYYGGVFRYKKDMAILEMTNLYGFEAFFHKQTLGSRYWEAKYNYPKLGLAVAYYNYGVPEELGKVYSATGYIDFTTKPQKKHQLRMNLGTGIVYSDKIYDPVTNINNKAIGATISYVLRGTVYYHYQIDDHWSLNLNAAFRHYSNGRSQMPNNGMNYPIIGAGVEYAPNSSSEFFTQSKKELKADISFEAYFATAWREVLYVDHKHKAYTISVFLSKRVSYYNSLLVGLDGFYYSRESIQKHLAMKGISHEPNTIDERMAAVTLGNKFHFGEKVELMFQAGFYIYDPNKMWSTWYQRYGIRYNVTDYFYIQPSLKAHSRKANMIEWGVGLSL